MNKTNGASKERGLEITARDCIRLVFISSLSAAWLLVASGCSLLKKRNQVDLGVVYDELAQLPDYQRNPVIVVPGILGSRLVDKETGDVTWGEMGPSGASPLRTRSLTELALPMRVGVPLHQLHDQVHSDGPLDQITFKFYGIPIRVNAYAQILASLGVGGYRDRNFRGSSGSNQVDYGDEHFTCFQFSYDWRRDISETAAELDRFIEEADAYTRQQYRERYGIENADIQFDIVAHSMGGLVTRYYLRYGSQILPDDGSAPELTWAGANKVGRAILVGTPNAGSTKSIHEMKDGMRLARPLPKFPPAVIGTMPAVYQLLPRTRNQALTKATGEVLDVLDPNIWSQLKWGLADPKQDRQLKKLLPNTTNANQRRRIALEHQFKCLVRARQFHDSIDIPAALPPGLEMHLYAGDAIETLDSLVADLRTGKITEEKMAAGDGTVTRTSAVSEERDADGIRRNIPWDSKTFLSSDHIGLTRDRTFVDNVLSRLLEHPVPSMIDLAAPIGHDWSQEDGVVTSDVPSDWLLHLPLAVPEPPREQPPVDLLQPEPIPKSFSKLLLELE